VSHRNAVSIVPSGRDRYSIAFSWANDAPEDVRSIKQVSVLRERLDDIFGDTLDMYNPGDPYEVIKALQQYLRLTWIVGGPDYDAWVEKALPYLKSVRTRDMLEQAKEVRHKFAAFLRELDEAIAKVESGKANRIYVKPCSRDVYTWNEEE